MKLSRVLKYINASADGLSPALFDREVDSFLIDSREVRAGDVFFALSPPEYRGNGFNGDFEDATRYISTAFERGAAACVLRRDRFIEYRDDLERFDGQLIFVDDCIAALQHLAHGVYLEWNRPVVGITGSAGKTTAKELTSLVLSSGGRKVLKNIKNYNNGLGHPLTVLNLVKDPGYDVAVLEMGMSTPMNEIARLCRITPPDVAVVLNVLPVHVEHLGSIENVAKAKAEIVGGLKPNGTAVLNADDARVATMRDFATETITFGIENDADVMARDISFSSFGENGFQLVTHKGAADVLFPLNGRHNILNALAAAAVGFKFGMTTDSIAAALSTAEAPTQRGDILRFAEGFTVINDSYNSNPSALLSMVKTLIDGSGEGCRRIVIAGEMLELGEEAARQHFEVGEEIAKLGADILIGVRGLAREMVAGAVASGAVNATYAEDSAAAGEMLIAEVREGDFVLVKGSRGVQTEIVIEKLFKKYKLDASGAEERSVSR